MTRLDEIQENPPMADERWNPWKLTAIGMALVVSAALVTGLVMAGWGPKETAAPVVSATRGPVRHVAATPSGADVEACNKQAKAQDGGAIARGGVGAGKGAAIGGVVGATAGTLYGLNENKQNDARYVEAYRACMRGRGYTG